MCRFTYYQGIPMRISSLVTEPDHSLILQSFSANMREHGNLNGDGFGLAWYDKSVKEEPALFQSVTPAWNNSNLIELAEMIDSTCILAHIRAATQSFEVTKNNCHPFKYKQYAFMHNGDIGGFQKIRRTLLRKLSDDHFEQIKGNTDSEHFFALLLDQLDGHVTESPEESMTNAMLDAFRELNEMRDKDDIKNHCLINSVFTDGIVGVITRYSSGNHEDPPSLFINAGNRYVCEDGVCYMIDPGHHVRSVIVSSEPLSEDPGWHEVPVNTLIVVRDGHIIEEGVPVT